MLAEYAGHQAIQLVSAAAVSVHDPPASLKPGLQPTRQPALKDTGNLKLLMFEA